MARDSLMETAPFPAGAAKRLLPPGIPVDGVVGVLQKVGRGRVDQTVRGSGAVNSLMIPRFGESGLSSPYTETEPEGWDGRFTGGSRSDGEAFAA